MGYGMRNNIMKLGIKLTGKRYNRKKNEIENRTE